MSDDPFEELDADAEGIDDPFAEMDVADLDEEAVWEELEAGTASDPEGVDAGRPATLPGESPPSEPDAGTGSGDADSVAVVPKSGYCQGCEHFSSPPRVGCTNPGTEIVELVGVDRFRVRNCPVVEGRRSAGNADEE